HRSVHGDVDSDVSADAKENQRPSALVHRAIGGDQQVRSQQILVQLQGSLQIRRARLFFSLKNDLQVHSQRNLFRSQRIDRCQQRHDRRSIIGGRACVNPPIVVIDRPV